MNNFILAAEYVTDTVGLIVYLEKRRLGKQARHIFDSAENAATIIYVPAMVFAEILYLAEKNRISTSLPDVKLLLQTHPNFREYPMTRAVVETAE